MRTLVLVYMPSTSHSPCAVARWWFLFDHWSMFTFLSLCQHSRALQCAIIMFPFCTRFCFLEWVILLPLSLLFSLHVSVLPQSCNSMHLDMLHILPVSSWRHPSPVLWCAPVWAGCLQPATQLGISPNHYGMALGFVSWIRSLFLFFMSSWLIPSFCEGIFLLVSWERVHCRQNFGHLVFLKMFLRPADLMDTLKIDWKPVSSFSAFWRHGSIVVLLWYMLLKSLMPIWSLMCYQEFRSTLWKLLGPAILPSWNFTIMILG